MNQKAPPQNEREIFKTIQILSIYTKEQKYIVVLVVIVVIVYIVVIVVIVYYRGGCGGRGGRGDRCSGLGCHRLYYEILFQY